MFQKLEDIYKETKFLDSLFAERYDIKSLEVIQKYHLELSVEIGELANETKCFKFWSNKKPNKSKVLEEYIDCLFMILYFCNILDVKLDEQFPICCHTNMNETFLKLYDLGVLFRKNLNKDIGKELLVELLYLAELLNFTMEELVNETKRKSLIVQRRFTTDY